MAIFSLLTYMWSDEIQKLADKILAINKGEDITLYQSTGGGSVSKGWALIGVMQDHGGKITIKALGDSSSMGFYNLLYVDVVESLDVTNFTIHRADGWTETEDDKKTLASINKSLRTAMEARIDQVKFEKITGVTFDEIFDPEQRISVTINAKDAKKVGLVHKIIKLGEKEIKAWDESFQAFALKVDPDAETDPEKKIIPKIEKPIKPNNHMDIVKFMAEHPSVYQDVLKKGHDEGVKAEKTRVEVLMKFHEIAPKAIIAAITDGTQPDPVFMADMTSKAILAQKEGKTEEEVPELSAKEKEELKTKEAVEYEASEKEVFEAMNLKKKEVK